MVHICLATVHDKSWRPEKCWDTDLLEEMNIWQVSHTSYFQDYSWGCVVAIVLQWTCGSLYFFHYISCVISVTFCVNVFNWGMIIYLSWKLNRFLCKHVYYYLIMTYYLKPPRGSIALHTLHKCVQQRFEYLVSLQNGEMIIPRNFEYLIDGSAMDRAGHFMLRYVFA